MGVPKVRGLSPELDQVQNRVDEGIARSVPSWIADGHELKGIVLPGSTVTKLAHKLGRRPAGWMLQRLRSPGNTFITEVGSDDTSLSLSNGTTAEATVDLWVW